MSAIKKPPRVTAVAAAEDVDVFQHDIVFSIAAIMGFVGWLTLWASLHYRHAGLLLVTVLLVGGALGSIKLLSVHRRGALICLILTLLSAIVCLKVFFPDSPAQYFIPLVVIVSGLLELNWSVFLVAALAGLTVSGVAHLQGAGWLDYSESLAPNILIDLTAIVIWLSARQLIAALGWMRTTYAHAQTLLEQLRYERASLARTLKQLEDAYQRIEKMNYELIEACSTAEEARRLKTEFAANISHELRTPLNIIIGFSETMANAPEIYKGVAWSPVLRGDIEQIYQSSRHLLSLIDDILDLSALDMRRLGMTVEETAIGQVIAEAAALMKDLFHAKQLYLRVQVAPGLPPVRIDATRIRQVLINLLTNASRFTITGGVTITAQLEGRSIQVAVADTGIGIASQDIAKVFDEFGQVDSSIRRKHEGSGLGVPLSKRLVELHNGRMWLESQPGQGSTFYFTLPVGGDRQSGLERSDWTVAATPGYKTVLMMEPDPILLNTVRRHLSQCEVIRVKRTDNLQELIERHRPAALIIDRQDMENGESEMAVPPDLPVITVQLVGQLPDAQTLGIRDFLIKPITRARLFEAIEGLGRPVRSVLVVDEDPALVDLVSRMLQAGGTFRISRAWSGEEALACMQRERVDLVLLDWKTGVTGLMVPEEMRKNPGLAEIPVIMLGGESPNLKMSTGGLDLRLIRTENASVAEVVNYLEILVGALPLRGRTDSEAFQPAPATPAVPPAS
jgi:signal transduction histidine kinase/DNA-binding response OmpR family regulator